MKEKEESITTIDLNPPQTAAITPESNESRIHKLKTIVIDGPEHADIRYFVAGVVTGFGVVVVPGYIILTTFFK